MFMLRGINFVDLAQLKEEDVKRGRIIYIRSKTHKMYSIEALPLVNEILCSYSDNNRNTLLPILTNEELNNKSELPARIRQLRKTCNKWLYKIGEELGFQEKLTTYVFRYSTANACKSMGYSKDMISESLGHNYGMAVSSCYLEDYDIELIDEMNKTVCNKIIRGA